MEARADRQSSRLAMLRLALAAFVVAWIFGPYAFRSAVPIWVPFLAALGLEVHFLLGGLRPGSRPQRDRRPQTVDRERYGFAGGAEELLLVRENGEELWIPYSGETDDEVAALIAEARQRPEGDVPSVAVLDHERRRLRPPVRRFLAGLGVIAALALILWVADSRTGWNGLDGSARAEARARFSVEASHIAAKPVTIRCDEAGDYVGAVQHADGVATVGGDVAYLTPERCGDLYRLAFEDEVQGSETGRALAVLAHEAWHLRGVRDEGTTECYALQSGVALGRRLGLSESRARQLMRQQLVENSLHAGASSEYLVTPDCRDGGRLDLNPNVRRFP